MKLFKLLKLQSFIFFKLILIFAFIAVSFKLYASTTNGTIDPTYYSALLCTNDVCTTSTQINFKPTLGNPIHVTDTAVTGNAWSETFGWINFNPMQGGVTNTASGVLGGYAWGDGAGWINFNPTQGGVTINTSGQFVGHAWSENYGWIKFDCNVVNACVKTDWRPSSVRPSGGSSGGYLPPTKPIVVIPIIQTPTLPVSLSIVKKPVVKATVVESTPNLVSNTNENNFINPQPEETPKITPSKKLVSSLDNTEQLESELDNSFWQKTNNFFVKTMGFIKSIIFSKYFMGISFSYELFNYKGYFNPLWVPLVVVIVLYFIYFLYKRRRGDKENSNINSIQR